MIEIRRLHPSEFDLLKGYADGFCPDAEKSVALVAENDTHIIGRIFLIAPVHCEGPHVDNAWRGGPLFKRLVDAAELEARSEGVNKLMAYAVDPTMEMYLKRLGYSKMDLTVWSKEL
jgi:N-acetylglutamate synthase-like GNAT family acetyltransferase